MNIKMISHWSIELTFSEMQSLKGIIHKAKAVSERIPSKSEYLNMLSNLTLMMDLDKNMIKIHSDNHEEMKALSNLLGVTQNDCPLTDSEVAIWEQLNKIVRS